MARLPATSSSRNIQKRHTRRIKTREGPRDILINPDVKKDVQKAPKTGKPAKKAPVSGVLTPYRPKLRPKDTRSRDLKPLDAPTRQLPSKVAWRDVMRKDSGM